ncbi:MAG: hypothetical protein AAF085_04995 [Planctomycetota bacterium]
MKSVAQLLTLALAVLFLAACGGDPHEEVVEEALDIMSDVEGILGEVSDEKSVEALGPKFEALGERMNELVKQFSELDEPSEEVQKALEEKYKPQMEEIQEKVTKQMERIQKEGGFGVLMALMKEMEKMEPSESFPEWME